MPNGPYGIADVNLLWELFRKKYPKGMDRKLTTQERRELIDELDVTISEFERLKSPKEMR
jgi:hypothetical protein